MTPLDWVIILLYAAGMVVLGWWLGRRQHTSEDYYLAGRRLGWFPIGVSTMATQLGAVSFLSAPAFVGLRPGGGLLWLGYELALPLAIIPLMAVLFPIYHTLRVTSVYETLERRFDLKVRVSVSLVFQISRGLATGVTVYAAAIVVSVTAGIPLWATILLIGFVAMLYELFGGIHVDIVSDTIQMVILLFGIILVGIVALHAVGGWSAVSANLDPARFQALDPGGHGLGDGRDFGLWPLLIGGFFLYLSYYGSDQSQVQRELSARSLDACKGSLFFNGLGRFPVVLTYCTVGLILGAWAVENPGFVASLPSGNVDYMVPVFIRDRLATGLTGFVFVAIMAAAMSSLDSAINSLSAATLEDVVKPLRRRPLRARQEYWISRILTFSWGMGCVLFAFQVGHIAPTVLEGINKIGSAFYGPVFAVFLTGILNRRCTSVGALVGLIAGVATNLTLWVTAPSVSWLWWNAFGFLIASGIMIASGIGRETDADEGWLELLRNLPAEKRVWKRSYLLLGGYALVLIALLALLPSLMR